MSLHGAIEFGFGRKFKEDRVAVDLDWEDRNVHVIPAQALTGR